MLSVSADSQALLLVIGGVVMAAAVASPGLGVAAFPLAAVGLPPIRQFLPPRGLFPEELVLASLTVSFILARGMRLKRHAWIYPLNFVLLGLLFSQGLTLLYVSLRWGAVPRDLLELVRTLKYLAILNLAAVVNARERRWAAYGVLVTVLVLVGVGCLQYANPGGVGDWLIRMYGWDSTARFLDPIQRSTGYWRIPGTAGNPNDFGTMLAVAVVGLLALAPELNPRGSKRVGLAIRGIALAGLVMLLLTQSRTALVGAGLSLLARGALNVWGRRSRWSGALFLALLVATALAVPMSPANEMLTRLRDEQGAIQSLTYRFAMWGRALRVTLADSAVLGLGPEKLTEVQRFEELDSEFVAFLKRWGLLGFTGYVVLLCLTGHLGLRLALTGKSRAPRSSGGGVLGLAIMAAVVSTTGAVWSQNRVSDLLFFLVGILATSGFGPRAYDNALLSWQTTSHVTRSNQPTQVGGVSS